MNAKVEKAAFTETMSALNPGWLALSGMITPVGRSIVKIVTSLQIAINIANRADRYYAMNNAQLARIGLTRSEIPAKLVRLFTELE